MSSAVPRKPRQIGPRKNVAIVASRYNERFVNGLIAAAKEELVASLPNAAIDLYQVPGAFEIPVCAEFVLKRTRADVLIALGVVIQGQTMHADFIGSAVTDALQELAVRHTIPVIHEVLTVRNTAQAEARCLGKEKNRGREAARSAAHMLELFQKLKSVYPGAVTAGVTDG